MRISKLKVTNKAKLFHWRTARNCLLTRITLQRVQVDCPGICPCCDSEDETDLHLFFTCAQAAEAVWPEVGPWNLLTAAINSARDSKESL